MYMIMYMIKKYFQNKMISAFRDSENTISDIIWTDPRNLDTLLR